MAERSLRGIRLGAQSLQSEDGVVLMDRTQQTYVCTKCDHETVLIFAADAEPPTTWECRNCGAEAVLRIDGEMVEVEAGEQKSGRTPWDMLLERRTRAELEEILEERLAYVRARRGDTSRAKIGA